MTQHLTKISLFFAVGLLLFSCNAVKNLEEDELLLTENTIIVDSTEIKDSRVYSQLYQRPNPRILGVPIGLHIYNLADPQPDSTFQRWLQRKPRREERLVRFLSKKQVYGLGRSYVNFNEWIQNSGSAPVIIQETRVEKSVNRLKRYYFTKGWFNVTADYTINKDTTQEKRGSVVYEVERYRPYFVDSISERISSPVVDSLFQSSKNKTFITPGEQYDVDNFINERDRLTIQFRNSGLYYFDQDYINFDADTVNTGHKVNVDYVIPDRTIKVGDSSYTEPFKVHKINEVRIVTDYTFANRNKTFTDSISYAGYTLYGYDEIAYRPKAITDAISIAPNTTFKDIDRTLTYNQLSNLRIFKYPNINYEEDPADTTGTGLITTILLSPRKKYNFGIDFDTYTSTIQQFGIGFSTSFLTRNVFRGAETLELSASGSVGSSKDASDGDSRFFNVWDLGGNVKLSFPRILFPLNTEKIIPKYMSPFTNISVGFNAQNNIGLDRQNINTIFNYNWEPSTIKTYTLGLIDIQYVRNLNPQNYFNVYQSSYDRLNEIANDIETAIPGTIDVEDYTVNEQGDVVLTIPSGANNFINDVVNDSIPNSFVSDLGTVRSIKQRKDRLSENNLIFATNFQWLRDTRLNLNDRNFSRLRWKLETAGNLLSLIGNAAGLETNANGKQKILGVAFSQYAKAEIEYIKHWELSNNTIVAIRTFGGLAAPYGNSDNIPFTRSYFAGGANDNRGWRAYELGPGSSGSVLDFNEANMKLAFNAEYRYTLLGAFKGAFFVDVGNIWNIWDDVEDEAFTFDGLADLKELAIASGLGLRYDFGFFVLRFDIGFKTYDPARTEGNRWFKDYNFKNAVYNIGVNYPF